MEKKVITKAMQKAFVKEYLQTQIFIHMRNKQKFNNFQKGTVLWGNPNIINWSIQIQITEKNY